MIMQILYSFLPHIPIYPANLHIHENCVKIKAPIPFDRNQSEINVPRRFLDKLLSQELFSIKMYHEDESFQKLVDANIINLSLLCKTEDTVDIEIVCEGSFENGYDTRDSFSSLPIRVITSHDIILDMKDENEKTNFNDRITNISIYADIETVRTSEVKGSICAINTFIGSKNVSPILGIIDKNINYRLDFGYKSLEKENWIFNIDEVETSLTRRIVKDGIDQIEFNFTGLLA